MQINRVTFAAALARADLNVNRLAELSGVSRATITSVKSGKSCSPATAEKLAAVLGCDIIGEGSTSVFGAGHEAIKSESEANEMNSPNTFRVTEDRRVFLDGQEIKRVVGFSINVEAGSDPEIIIRVLADRIEIDGYTDISRGLHPKGKEG